MANEPNKPPANLNKMGLRYGLDKGDFCLKRTNRWLFTIPGVCADDTAGVDALPPEKSARPSLSFKEMEVRHLNEDVFYPVKPDWKPITITLFDLRLRTHPVVEWVKKMYNPAQGAFFVPNNGANQQKDSFIKECNLSLYDGCGNRMEQWIYEDAWINSANFQSLDMTSSGYLTCEITLRYARAYTI
jgi:hypothetical protein